MTALAQHQVPDEGPISLADSAYARLRRLIVEAELWPGACFSENEIAGRLELGKTPIREALLRLRLEGLVEVRPRAGYEVAPVTLRGARDSLGLRGALDAEAAGHACSQRSAGEVLGALNRELLAGAGKTLAGRIDADQRFHLALAGASGNQVLADAIARSFSEYLRLAHVATAIDQASFPPLPDHTELSDAIAAEDVKRAQALARAEAQDEELRIVQALISSESVVTANVLPSPSTNKFYLDIPKGRKS